MKKISRLFVVASISLLIVFPSVVSASQPSADLSKLRQAEQMVRENAQKAVNYSVRIKKDPLLVQSQTFLSSIKGKKYEELSNFERSEMMKLTKASIAYVESITNSAANRSENVVAARYLEDELSKGIEAAVVGLDSNLSAGNILTAFANSNEARDIGVLYADLMGYSQTWDNPADAYRHFAWNWFNTEDMNASKARLFGDYHELALAAADYVNKNYSFLPFDSKVVIGTTLVYEIHENTQESLSNFNEQFDNASVMDIYNNRWGRTYSTSFSFTNVADAFYEAFFDDEKLIGWTSDVTSSKRSIAYSYWD